ncbi:bifunctional diaminohydroxyphosphoribosylaminopyrimidine deaminase/5-amino-6-(5-phosphoribosylamino)uracil reductase RibD [Treponema sp.]|uniref:bifunctional diaminohydroxyphosphoribosylaminopyrimidine deaminase/5-amino-6-(5-phosphoribosylamino)uracil reductase RibD n=1 Tax=Treponema sp. TaxID=166 RepID=UPI00257FC812|nr:bifunctional diaminohydroxyphosphoribosylaminopyrimidine deaminase/5-amino-6-(5-phosphoribosylamino)uracil reductase RibD [Treponema sp.]MBE6353269.1 bifunctional diaminohydroxyphosphoribosylaminopyrimidine deaminase/5-amino-6-(5-phosphoribosylamino)uracil reductase RibD [Treponema sp.]
MKSSISNYSKEDFMRRAIELALQGEGFVHPNPMVGAVIVRDNKILAEGYHHNYGNLHAERDALKNAAEQNISVEGAELFVTLEPCCHHGKQPPCTQAIIDAKIKKVYIGSRDPNPLVNGKGVQILKDAGIEVVQDFLKEECDSINKIFFHYIKYKTPYVILKYAMTLDGQTATYTKDSKWISGNSSRTNVHKTRANVSAVLTGIQTALADDPMLNCRLEDGKKHFNPVRIVLDSSVQLKKDSALVRTAKEIPVIDVCAEKLSSEESERMTELKNLGVEFIQIESCEGRIDLEKLLVLLGERGIDSILVESGGFLNASFLFQKKNPLVNEIHVYLAPKFFGNDGTNIFNPVRGLGIELAKDALTLKKPEIEFFEDDILLKYEV